MEKSIQFPRLTLGVCYYPEHWPEEIWADDLSRMKTYGIEIVRIAEFAWTIFEPEEGTFSFNLFDRFLDVAEQTGMKIVFGTPTATPPAWLTERYPETLNCMENGIPYQHGQRRHYNYNAPIYQKLSVRIAEELAKHYGHRECIIGWQIDNELNCETDVFYSEADHAAFRVFLKNKYGDLDKLNHAWGNVFWNQTYTDWEQIHLTRPTTSNSINPHLSLDEKRFFSDSAIRFCRLQAEVLRKYIAQSQFITTNGWYGHLDNHKMTREMLDFFSYDSYPNFAFALNEAGTDELKDRNWSLNLALVRSVSPIFCVMEQQSGAGGWTNRLESVSPKPGQMRLWTLQSVAHGADYISYFRWRTCTFGTEIYWHGINNYDNRPNRRLKELERIAADAHALASVAGKRYQAKAAIARDYDNEWDGELDHWHGPLSQYSVKSWFTAFQKKHIPSDFIDFTTLPALEDLAAYTLIVYSHPAILTQETADLLEKYVHQGGTLILGARTGYKNSDGHCITDPMPGYASSLCGVTVEDFTLIADREPKQFADWGGVRLEAPLFADILVPNDESQVLAAFTGDYYAEKPALVSRKYGEGTAYYYGSAFSTQTASIFLDKLEIASPFKEIIEASEGVELAMRGEGTETYLFALNFSSENSRLQLHTQLTDILTDERLTGNVTLPPYGVRVFVQKQE